MLPSAAGATAAPPQLSKSQNKVQGKEPTSFPLQPQKRGSLRHLRCWICWSQPHIVLQKHPAESGICWTKAANVIYNNKSWWGTSWVIELCQQAGSTKLISALTMHKFSPDQTRCCNCKPGLEAKILSSLSPIQEKKCEWLLGHVPTLEKRFPAMALHIWTCSAVFSSHHRVRAAVFHLSPLLFSYLPCSVFLKHLQ